MKKHLLLSLVCVCSSLLSVFVYSRFAQPSRIVWNGQEGEVRYTGLVDKLFDDRSTHAFHSASPTNFIDAANVATPAVVNIRALLETGNNLWGKSALTGSSGSGVIMSPDGYIVTNHHVIDGAKNVKIKLFGGASYTEVEMLTDDANIAMESNYVELLEAQLVDGLLGQLGTTGFGAISLPMIDLSAMLGLPAGTAVLTIHTDSVARTDGTSVIVGSF